MAESSQKISASLNASGILKDLCNKKMNRSKYNLPSFKKFYTKELKNITPRLQI